MNNENLISFDKMSSEKHREISRKGAKKSAESRKIKKSLKMIMTEFSNSKITEKQLKDKLKALGFKSEDLTNKVAVGIGLWESAIKGNINAYREFMNLTDEPLLEADISKHNPFEDLTVDELKAILNECQ